MKEIKKQVQHIAECLSNPDLFDADCFEDGEVSAFNYLATVEGYWWNDKHFESYNDELGLDEVLEELWGCR